MADHRMNILSTRPLSQHILSEASRLGFQIDTIPFIDVAYSASNETVKAILQMLDRPAFVVFTSKHAVEAISKVITDKIPDWKVFCLSGATLEAVENLFGKKSVLGKSDSAKVLSRLIIENQVPELVFFCGNQRRDDLLVNLSEQNIHVQEHVVYQTHETPVKLDRTFRAILFFSPSAVKSFFSSNHPDQEVIFFAIGHTTADAIKNHTKNKMVVAEFPSEENMLNKLINFFKEDESAEQFVKKIR